MADALRRAGFTLLGQNVRMQRGELDLVVRGGGRLWFVECKARGRSDRGPPHRAIDARKKRALFAAAREYVVEHHFEGDYGFLVASVVPGEDDAPRVDIGRLPMTPADGTGAG